jgi:hypothetical protein
MRKYGDESPLSRSQPFECGGKRSATPLSIVEARIKPRTFDSKCATQSGVALRLPPHSKMFSDPRHLR